MLGFRGYRLSVLHPEITEMQVKAIIAAELDDHVMFAVRLYRLDAADKKCKGQTLQLTSLFITLYCPGTT